METDTIIFLIKKLYQNIRIFAKKEQFFVLKFGFKKQNVHFCIELKLNPTWNFKF